MGNPIKYSATVTSGSYQKGNVAVGVNPINYNPTATTGWYNSPTPTGGNFIVTEVIDGNTPPRFYAPTTDNEWLRLARQEGATGADTGSTTAIKSWFASQANYVVTNIDFPTTLPSIVGNGQITYLDSEFTTSYPGSGTTWFDISGLGNNGTLYNGPTFNNGAKYIQFDGVDDYASTISPGDTGSIQFTYYWTGNVQCVITGNIGGGYAMLYNGGSGTVVHWYPASGTYEFYGILPSRAGWYNITLTWGGTNDNKMYMNGALVMSSTAYSISKPPIWYWAGNHYTPQAIRLQTIQTYNKILTQAEVLQNHHKGNIVTDGLVLAVDAGNIVSYQSGSTLTYNLSGSSNGTTQGVLTVNMSGSLTNGTSYNSGDGGVWNFDGVDDYIFFGNPSSLQFNNATFSYGCWFYWPNTTTYGIIMGKRDGNNTINVPGGSNYNQWGLTIADTMCCGPGGRNIGAYLSCDGGAVQGGNLITSLPNTQGWVHAFVTVNTTEQKLYINGELKVTTTQDFTGRTFNIVGRSFYIGCSGGETEGTILLPFNNKISLAQVYNKTLTGTEITQNFNAQRSRFGI